VENSDHKKTFGGMATLRKVLLWVGIVFGVSVVVFIAALIISARLDPVPSCVFSHNQGTFDYYFGWEDAELLEMYPDGRAKREVVEPIAVKIASNEWANLYIVYTLGMGRIYGVDGEAYIVDQNGNCLWRCCFDGMLEDFCHHECWWIVLADVDGDGRAEVIVCEHENEEGLSWTDERALKTIARHMRIERLDGKQTEVDQKTLPRWRKIRFFLWI